MPYPPLFQIVHHKSPLEFLKCLKIMNAWLWHLDDYVLL